MNVNIEALYLYMYIIFQLYKWMSSNCYPLSIRPAVFAGPRPGCRACTRTRFEAQKNGGRFGWRSWLLKIRTNLTFPYSPWKSLISMVGRWLFLGGWFFVQGLCFIFRVYFFQGLLWVVLNITGFGATKHDEFLQVNFCKVEVGYFFSNPVMKKVHV